MLSARAQLVSHKSRLLHRPGADLRGRGAAASIVPARATRSGAGEQCRRLPQGLTRQHARLSQHAHARLCGFFAACSAVVARLGLLQMLAGGEPGLPMVPGSCYRPGQTRLFVSGRAEKCERALARSGRCGAHLSASASFQLAFSASERRPQRRRQWSASGPDGTRVAVVKAAGKVAFGMRRRVAEAKGPVKRARGRWEVEKKGQLLYCIHMFVPCGTSLSDAMNLF